jgi:hypothetical protein
VKRYTVTDYMTPALSGSVFASRVGLQFCMDFSLPTYHLHFIWFTGPLSTSRWVEIMKLLMQLSPHSLSLPQDHMFSSELPVWGSDDGQYCGMTAETRRVEREGTAISRERPVNTFLRQRTRDATIELRVGVLKPPRAVRVKYGHESRGTRNQESLYWRGPAAI